MKDNEYIMDIFIREAANYLEDNRENLDYIPLEGGLYTKDFISDFVKKMKKLESKFAGKK